MFRAYVPAYTASACIRIGNASQARAHRFPFATSSQMHVRVFLSPMRREGGGRRHKADQNNNTKERQRCEAMIKKVKNEDWQKNKSGETTGRKAVHWLFYAVFR